MWVEEAIYGLWSQDEARVQRAFCQYTPGDQDVIVEFMLTAALRFEFSHGHRPTFAMFTKLAEYTSRAYEEIATTAPYLLATIMWDLYYRDNRLDGIELGAMARAELETMAVARILAAHRAGPDEVRYLRDAALLWFYASYGRRATG